MTSRSNFLDGERRPATELAAPVRKRRAHFRENFLGRGRSFAAGAVPAARTRENDRAFEGRLRSSRTLPGQA